MKHPNVQKSKVRFSIDTSYQLAYNERGSDKMSALFTIGYENRNLSEFIDRIKKESILAIIDVRRTPISRKKGFSKSVLRDTLNRNGIEYIHLKTLGSPKELRNELYEQHDYERFFSEYRYYVTNTDRFDDVVLALKIAEEKTACLLCYEFNSRECHRSVLSDIMRNISYEISEVRNL